MPKERPKMDIPNELIIEIISFVEDTPSLYNLTLASKTFQRLTEPLLYRRFNDQSRKGATRAFVLAILRRPDLADHVTEIAVDIGVDDCNGKSGGVSASSIPPDRAFRKLRRASRNVGLVNREFLRCLRNGTVFADVLLLTMLLPNLAVMRFKDIITRCPAHPSLRRSRSSDSSSIGASSDGDSDSDSGSSGSSTTINTGNPFGKQSLCILQARGPQYQDEDDSDASSTVPGMKYPLTDWMWTPSLESMEIFQGTLWKRHWGRAIETVTDLSLDNCQLKFTRDELRLFFSSILCLRSFKLAYVNDMAANSDLRPEDIIWALSNSHASTLIELKFICCFGWEDPTATIGELSGEIIGGTLDLKPLYKLRHVEVDQFTVEFTTALSDTPDFRYWSSLPTSIETFRIQCCSRYVLRHLEMLAIDDYVDFPDLRSIWISECDYGSMGSDDDLKYLEDRFAARSVGFGWWRRDELAVDMMPISGVIDVPRRTIGGLSLLPRGPRNLI